MEAKPKSDRQRRREQEQQENREAFDALNAARKALGLPPADRPPRHWVPIEEDKR